MSKADSMMVLVLPFVLLGAILASAGMAGANTDGLALNAILQIVLGPLAGIATGWGVARAHGFCAGAPADCRIGGRAWCFSQPAFAAYVLADSVAATDSSQLSWPG
jgi:hypothetical protein